MKIYFLTGNKNKLDEAMAIMPEIESKDVDLPEIQEIDPKKIIEIKLEAASKVVEGNLMVEDNSLYMSATEGLPGPLIKWFMKTIGSRGLVDIATKLGNSAAEAKVWIGYLSEGKTEFFEGNIKGKIVEPRGENGFGWDAIFEVEGTGKTFAEMTSEEKNKISMRKVALEKLKSYLELGLKTS